MIIRFGGCSVLEHCELEHVEIENRNLRISELAMRSWAFRKSFNIELAKLSKWNLGSKKID
jgi:hypothetical protein